MVQPGVDLDYQVAAVCRKKSIEKLDAFKTSITLLPGATDLDEITVKGF
jgi:hypothetical protein